MKLSISNLAWDVREDDAVARLLASLGVRCVDVAPGKYFPRLAEATDAEVLAVRRAWSDRGFAIFGMQSLLFGTAGLNVFGPPEVQDRMLAHLDAACRVGALLGAGQLVFGSPANRDRRGLSDEQAVDLAIPFFRRLGDVAAKWGVAVCLEPNPARYGANFMITTHETARVVEQVDHPAIRLQCDTGALWCDTEPSEDTVPRLAHLVGHLHLSEPGLRTLGDSCLDHARMSVLVRDAFPGRILCIEMLASTTEPHLSAVERAVRFAQLVYGATDHGS